ncbi:MAG: hypothetical protein ACK4OP_14850, partial [Gemmobacter sp.]
VSGGRPGRLSLVAALLLAMAAPAAAEVYEIFPTNKRSADGNYRGVIDVWKGGGEVVEFRVDRGDIDARAVLDPLRAIAFVVDHFRLSPARDVVFYCPGGIVRVQCRAPIDPGDVFDPTNRVVRWP